LRIGTPALATRGFGDEEFAEVADIIARTLSTDQTPERIAELRRRVEVLTEKFPLYGESIGEAA
jgi:glycine hydroxymethyltransferase